MKISALACTISSLMFNADKGGGSGGSDPKKTDLEQLQEAKDRIKVLEGDLGKVTGERDGLETKLTDATTQIGTLTGERDQLTKDLSTAQGEVKSLKETAKTTSQRAQEISAAAGVPAIAKPADAAGVVPGAKDGKALYDDYSKLDGREARDFWAQHDKALIAYGEQCLRDERRRND